MIIALVMGVLGLARTPNPAEAHGTVTAASVAGCYAGNALVDGVPLILELVFEPITELSGMVTVHAGSETFVRPYTVSGGAILIALGGMLIHSGPALFTGGQALSLSLTSFPGAEPKVVGSVFLYSTEQRSSSAQGRTPSIDPAHRS